MVAKRGKPKKTKTLTPEAIQSIVALMGLTPYDEHDANPNERCGLAWNWRDCTNPKTRIVISNLDFGPEKQYGLVCEEHLERTTRSGDWKCL